MKNNYSRQTIKIFWQHTTKYAWAFWLTLILTITASIINLVVPLYYKKFFDQLTVLPLQTSILVQIIIIILFINLAGWISWRAVSFLASWFQSNIMADLYNTCFAYLHKHSFSFFNNNFVGSLVKRVNRLPRAYEAISDLFYFDVISLIISLAFIIVVLFTKSWLLGSGILFWVIIYCLANYFFSIYKLKFDLQRAEADSKVTAVLADTVTNHHNVKLFNGYQREKKNFQQVTAHWQNLQLFSWNLGNKFEAVQTFLMIGLEFGVFYLAISLWKQGLVTIGDFVLLQAYILVIFNRLWHFGRIFRRYYESMADADEMTEILLTEHEIKDNRQAKDLVIHQGAIDFIDVIFNYHSTRNIFAKLNLNIKGGEKIAIVGSSGSGKSTLVNLLLRNYELSGGKILVDQQKINQVTQESLWANISLVPQDPILFHRSLQENIRYGKIDATDAEVIAAAKLANCHEFISQFPDGYATFVGERGVKLSGGERQRVAIARAILKNAPILVFDEATSSLDSESEKLIQEALNVLMTNKTVIVIAHRLSTIAKMDRIIVLDNGQIVEQGTHQQLVKIPKGIYKNLWDKQVGGFIVS